MSLPYIPRVNCEIATDNFNCPKNLDEEITIWNNTERPTPLNEETEAKHTGSYPPQNEETEVDLLAFWNCICTFYTP
jgi:hypothetical protein